MKIIKNYKEAWDFIKESKNYIFVGCGLFVLFAIIGVIFPIFFKQQILVFIQEIESKVAGMGLFQLIWFIIYNNVRASAVALLFGLAFGIVPILVLVANGYLLGFVARYSVNQNGILILWKLLPHGIFELPAVLLAASLGIKIGFSLFDKKFSKKFWLAIKTFLLVIIPLLIIAGIIEGSLIFLLR